MFGKNKCQYILILLILALVLIVPVLVSCGDGDKTNPTTSPTPTTTPTPTATATPPQTATPAPTISSDQTSIARSYVEAMASGDYASAEAMGDSAMLAAAPAAIIEQFWQMLVIYNGAFQSLGDVTPAFSSPRASVIVPVTFANFIVGLKVLISQEGKVMGLGTVSITPRGGTPTPADYVNPDSFTESDVTVGSAPWALPGTLTMPNGTGPFPAVVLIAGSGPMDRDETFGLVKPLLDLAWGLASQGIAVLRYDKRTLVYSSQMAQLSDYTVKEEITEDAISAISLLRSTPNIDPSRVFLIGHSLGAYLAPRIAAQVPGHLKGIAMLEAPSSTMLQLIIVQYEYSVSLQGSLTEQQQQQLDFLKQQVALAESSDLSVSTTALELLSGLPASYGLDLRTYDPVTTAASLDIPLYFTQGGRDVQVPPSELKPFQTALEGKSNVTFKVYPELDHGLYTETGQSKITDCYVPGHHMEGEAVSDLATWILGN